MELPRFPDSLTSGDCAGSLDATDVLQQTVAKLVRYGDRVGVRPEEMISLLDSGISIQDFLAFLAAKSSGAA